jgi:hypothetical protein
MSNLDNSYLINFNSNIPIKSSSSDDIYYISILYNKYKKKLEFNCTCGLKYNIPLRNKCKHISEIKKILNETPVSKKDEINEILSNLSKIKI